MFHIVEIVEHFHCHNFEYCNSKQDDDDDVSNKKFSDHAKDQDAPIETKAIIENQSCKKYT